MSRYLIRRIEENPSIDLQTQHRDRGARRRRPSRARALARRRTGDGRDVHDVRHVFVMTGAAAEHALARGLRRARREGLHQDRPRPDRRRPASRPNGRSRGRRYLLETSLPGVFAVGDVRGGSIKRVASAVGEGSIAVAFVHQALTE